LRSDYGIQKMVKGPALTGQRTASGHVVKSVPRKGRQTMRLMMDGNSAVDVFAVCEGRWQEKSMPANILSWQTLPTTQRYQQRGVEQRPLPWFRPGVCVHSLLVDSPREGATK
jgi:hypothetical protein